MNETATPYEATAETELAPLVTIPACSIELTRGQRGTYGWQIKYRHDDPYEAERIVDDLDSRFKRRYGGGEDSTQ